MKEIDKKLNEYLDKVRKDPKTKILKDSMKKISQIEENLLKILDKDIAEILLKTTDIVTLINKKILGKDIIDLLELEETNVH